MQNNTSKINTVLLVVLVILAGILVFRPYFKHEDVAYTPTPMPEVNQNQQHQNVNPQYGFYFDYGGLVSKDLSMPGSSLTVIGFQPENLQVNQPRPFVVEATSDATAPWDDVLNSGNTTSVAYNGITYLHMKTNNENADTYHYFTTHNGVRYRIMTTNPRNMTLFGFVQ